MSTKIVRKSEVRDYIAYGWSIWYIASAPPPDYDPSMIEIEWKL